MAFYLQLLDGSYLLKEDGSRLILESSPDEPTLVVADSESAQESEAVSLTQQHTLAVADSESAQEGENVELLTSIPLVVADGESAQESEAVSLTQQHTLVVADGESAQDAESPTLVIPPILYEHSSPCPLVVLAEHASPCPLVLLAEHQSSAALALLYEHASALGFSILHEHSADCPLTADLWYEHSAPAPLVPDPVDYEHSSPSPLALLHEHSADCPLTADLWYEHTAPTPLLAEIWYEHSATAPLVAGDPILYEHTAWYAIGSYDAALDTVTHSVTVGGTTIECTEIVLEQDEGGYWSAELVLANPEDFPRFRTDTAVTVTIGGDAWSLIVDRRSANRRGPGFPSARVYCLGTAASLDEPRATPITKTWEQAIAASAAVTELLGSVTWQMIDGPIPAYRLAAQDAPPISVARRIVEEAGGVLDLLRDGSITARPLHPVSVPDYAAAGPDLTLTAVDDIFQLDEQLARDRIINSVRIYDTDGAGFRDSLEWVPDEERPLRGQLRAYPSPWREVTLRTSAGARVTLGLRSEQTRTIENERLEFADGVANTSRPIVSLQSVSWITDDLGALVHDAYSTELRAASAGYSIALVSYVTRHYTWSAVANQETPAQLILEDAA